LISVENGQTHGSGDEGEFDSRSRSSPQALKRNLFWRFIGTNEFVPFPVVPPFWFVPLSRFVLPFLFRAAFSRFVRDLASTWLTLGRASVLTAMARWGFNFGIG
jgi:hypothetical protein